MSAKPCTEALGAIHETMQALHQIGAVDRETMGDFAAACLNDATPLLLSEQEAADYLNVSLAFLRQQLQTWELACTDQPGDPFLNRQDVVAYKQRVGAQRRQALDEIAEQAQELDMGYDVR